MAVKRITLPNNVVFATSATRRYALVKTYRGACTVYKRSDSRATIDAERRTHRVTRDDDGRLTRWFVVDVACGCVADGHGDMRSDADV